MDDAQQLLLWRWSTIFQLTSLAIATAFFALLARASRRPELRSWMRAWLANFLALAVTSVYWVLQPASLFPLFSLLYLAAKAVFVALLMQGVWLLMHRGGRWYTTRQIATVVLIYAVAGAAFCRDLVSIGILQHTVLGLTLVGYAIATWRSRQKGIQWLAAGIGVRGVLSLGESFAYVLRAVQPDAGLLAGLVVPAGTLLSASSSFDTAAEWLILLGGVLAVSDRSRRELQDANRDLVAAQEDLRRLADRDPLTALVNRRSLPDIFRAVQPNGALMLFFDLDGFKKINDVHGHAAGDVCLKLFASALRDSFRPEDHVIRYGGDEFLVVATGLDETGAQARVDEVRKRMLRTKEGESICKFSVGMAILEPGGHPETALEAADARMYQAKHHVTT
jgi:diguanylate cyclase (GGDEF)-like protein